MVYNGIPYKDSSVYNGGTYKMRTVYKENGGTVNTVNIDGIDYPFIEINGLKWTTLSFKSENMDFYTPSNNVKTNGLLYKARTMFSYIIPILPTGWRVPSLSDINNLYGLSTDARDFISVDKGGNDRFGFNLKLIGYRNTSGSKVYFDQFSLIWTNEQKDTTHTWNAAFKIGGDFDPVDWSAGAPGYDANTALEIRFCSG